MFGNRYFYLSFALAFFVLSILFLFLTTAVRPDTVSAAGEVSVPEQEAFTPAPEDALSVLFIGSRRGGETAGSFILARFDPARSSVPIVALPPQTLVQHGDKTEPLSLVYQYGGGGLARDALAVTLGVPVDRYVHMSTDVFAACAGIVGSVEFDLPLDIPVEENGLQITLQAGIQLLDGKKTADIIGYRSYEGGEASRCKLVGELAAAIVNQRLDIAESTLADKVFEEIINLIDTDISRLDYDNRKEAAIFLARQGEPAVALAPTGSFSENGEGFVLSDTFVAIVRQMMA